MCSRGGTDCASACSMGNTIRSSSGQRPVRNRLAYEKNNRQGRESGPPYLLNTVCSAFEKQRRGKTKVNLHGLSQHPLRTPHGANEVHGRVSLRWGACSTERCAVDDTLSVVETNGCESLVAPMDNRWCLPCYRREWNNGNSELSVRESCAVCRLYYVFRSNILRSR